MTTALILIPLVAAAILAINPTRSRNVGQFALLVTLAEIVVAAVALVQFNAGQGLQFVTDKVWISDFVGTASVHYHVGMDGLSLFMVLLTNVGIAAAVGAGLRAGRDKPAAFYGLMMLLEAALVLLFTAQDLVLFYVGWEVMLIPLFVMMAVWGGEGRRGATIRFVIYTMVGSLLMLVAIAAIGIHYHTYEVSQIHSGLTWLFFFFAAAFCIKAPLFPLHGWLPSAYRQSSPEVTALLSGVISKAGAYGLLRFCAARCSPAPAHDWRWLFLGLAVVGLMYGSIVAFRQPDARGVVAYSSLGQMNLIIIGIFALNANGSTGAIFQMVNHGLVSLAAFLVIGLIELRAGSDAFAGLGGLANLRPRFSTILLLSTMFMLAVPGSSVFVSELYILIGAFQQQAWLGAVAACAIVLAAMYALRWFSALAHLRNGDRVAEDTPDLGPRELAIAVPLILLLFATTVYPYGVMHRVTGSVTRPAAGQVQPPAAALPATSKGEGR